MSNQHKNERITRNKNSRCGDKDNTFFYFIVEKKDKKSNEIICTTLVDW